MMKAVLLLVGGWFCLQVCVHAQPLDAFEQNRRLGRGVNIIGYDPLWRSPEQARFHEKHFRLIKGAGFQSVRVNLHPFGSMDPA